MSKHTPGPLRHRRAGANHWLYSADGYAVAFVGGNDTIFALPPGMPHEANAEHLVKCWNCHDDLLAALSDMVGMVPGTYCLDAARAVIAEARKGT